LCLSPHRISEHYRAGKLVIDRNVNGGLATGEFTAGQPRGVRRDKRGFANGYEFRADSCLHSVGRDFARIGNVWQLKASLSGFFHEGGRENVRRILLGGRN
jgi:hypothetical protein